MDFNKYIEPLGGKKRFIVLCIIVGFVFISFGGCTALVRRGSKSNNTQETTTVTQTVESSVEESESETSETTEETTTTEATTTIDYTADMDLPTANAFESGLNYLAFSAFSRDGLIGQLSSEYGDGYTVEQATAAVDALEEYGLVDWNDQAVKSAESYLDFSAFSKQGLIDQLSSEYGSQFTEEQATYAVQYLEDNNLVDWNEQAVKSAESYLNYTTFSRKELIDQLTSEYGEKFTEEQAEYAADQVGLT